MKNLFILLYRVYFIDYYPKHLFNEAQGMYSENFSDALKSVNLFIEKLERQIFNDK